MTGKLIGIAIRTKVRAAMVEITRAAVTLDRGVADDARGVQQNRKVTVLFRNDWEAACADHGKQPPWTTRRANLFVDADGRNAKHEGARIKIGPVVLEVYCETDPCNRMDEQSQGLREALTPNWRGGVACKVLTPGDISIGDRVEVVE